MEKNTPQKQTNLAIVKFVSDHKTCSLFGILAKVNQGGIFMFWSTYLTTVKCFNLKDGETKIQCQLSDTAVHLKHGHVHTESGMSR